jgi:hypothetical protein
MSRDRPTTIVGKSELPPVYVLQSIERSTWMSLTTTRGANEKDAASYVIAFEHESHARMVQLFAHERTKVHLAKHAPIDITHVIEKECGIDVGSFDKAGMAHINADPDAHIAISKYQNINKMGCRIDTIAFDEFMSFPYERCLGIAILRHLISHNNKELIFQSEVVEPIWDEAMFRHMLEQRHIGL